MKMSRQTIILSLFLVLLQWQPWSIVSAVLTPPPGYSLSLTGKTSAGIQKYACQGGVWTKTGSYATIYSSNGAQLGRYSSAYNKQTNSYTYYWSIINTPGDFGETGQTNSGIEGSVVQTYQTNVNSIPAYLAIVEAHVGSGNAERIAFVALIGVSGGMPPSKSLCSTNGATSGVPFSGVFNFYTQDEVPPQVPASLQARGVTFVENFFVEGKNHYKFLNGQWSYLGVIATIYDVTGGKVLGTYGTVNQDQRGNPIAARTVFKFNNPNGFWFQSQLCAKPVQMYQYGFPWQLYKVLSFGGYSSPLGNIKYVLLTSSLGGLPPQIAARANGITYGSSFSGQCHLYA